MINESITEEMLQPLLFWIFVVDEQAQGRTSKPLKDKAGEILYVLMSINPKERPKPSMNLAD